ncbi:hypothetical protein AWB64_01884 [Caballeronia sordidicola]|uniref:Uncharacterized protein n=2 Tax=Caballeronia sordidicola TaxID=196367 RepID=A0A158FV69_CABSO|nr:hypothetical protein AWB64_01884 [Caballeronia sordidicola]
MLKELPCEHGRVRVVMRRTNGSCRNRLPLQSTGIYFMEAAVLTLQIIQEKLKQLQAQAYTIIARKAESALYEVRCLMIKHRLINQGVEEKPDLKQKQRVTQSVTGKSSPITDRTRLTATVLPMMMNADFMAIAMMMVWRGGRRHDGGHGYCCGGKREYQGFHITPVRGRRTDEAGHADGHGVTSVITANAAGSKGIIK